MISLLDDLREEKVCDSNRVSKSVLFFVLLGLGVLAALLLIFGLMLAY